MSDREFESGEEDINEAGENPTQQRMGEGEPVPADVSWDEGDQGATPDEIEAEVEEELVEPDEV